MPPTNIARMISNPLMQSTREGDFFSLVLAECALLGVPAEALALFRDLHSMLGFSKPMAANQAAALAGPLVAWRSYPNQPHFDSVPEVERLAYYQRALTAFGGGAPGEMVGRAEIVHAMGNIMRETQVPPEYLEVFEWAATDVQAMLEGKSRDQVLKEKKDWRRIEDREVIHPQGRLYATYQEIATNIRREGIASLEKYPLKHPRSILRPWAAHFVDNLTKLSEEAERDNLPKVKAAAEQQLAVVHRMFPNLGTFEEEVTGRRKVVHQAVDELETFNTNPHV